MKTAWVHVTRFDNGLTVVVNSNHIVRLTPGEISGREHCWLTTTESNIRIRETANEVLAQIPRED